MTIEMTVTTDIQASKSGYAGVKKHVEHDPSIHHSNHDILKEYTKYNVVKNDSEEAQKIADWQEEQFGDWLEDRNRKQREKGRAERQIDGVKSWLKNKKKYTGVLTLGSMETTNQLMKLLVPAEALETRKTKDGQERVYIRLDHPEEAKKFYGMYDLAFNKWLGTMDNPASTIPTYQKIGRHAMHVDELGAPHLHYEVAFAGKTAKGRPTPSVDAALKTFWQDQHPKESVPYSREVWSWYRSIMDELGTRALKDAIKEVYGNEGTVKLIRKSKGDPTVITGLSMAQFKAIHAETAKAKAEKAEVDKQISAKTHTLADLTTQEKTQREVLTRLNDQVKDLDDQINTKDQEVKSKTAEAAELTKAINHRLKNKRHIEMQIDQLQTAAEEMEKTLQQKNEEYNLTEQHHRAVMTRWEEDEEDARARRDGLLTENWTLEQKNTRLRATQNDLQTAIDHRSGLLDQLNNNLRQWIGTHIKRLVTLALNVNGGKAWMKEQGCGFMVQQQFRQDYADDLDRLMSGQDVPKRYYNHPGMGWTRRTYKRNQRQQVQTTRQEDGPEL